MCLVTGSVFAAATASAQDVIVTETDALYTLDNGIVTARVSKASGDLVSLRYNEMEMLATFTGADGQPDLARDPAGANPNGLNRGMTDHQYSFWSHDAMGPRGTAPAIPAGPINNGLIFDYLRLELDESAQRATGKTRRS